jgi:Mg2+ and Co2+ transporter CorA
MGLNVRGGDSLFWKTGLDTDGLKTDGEKVKGILRGLTSQISAMDIFAAISIGAAYHAQKAIKEFTLLAARYETLGVVMETVGHNAGYTAEQMNELQAGLEKTGISMIQARQNLIRMVQAQLDLTKANQLARIAQDAAVIGNINSSEAFERMIHGIQAGQVEVLRTIGLNVTFESGYKKLAETLGKNTDELTDAEKAQSRMNTVMDAGVQIAGSYEAAMSTAGKQMLSLERYTENLKVMLGQAFTPALTEIIENITGEIKDVNKSLDENKEKTANWGDNFRLVLISVEAEIIRLAMFIDRIGGTMSSFAGIAASMIPGYTPDFAEKMASWNVGLEDRYNKSMKALEELAKRYVDLQNAMTPAAKEAAKAAKDAAEQKLLAAQKEAEAAKITIKTGADLKKAANETGSSYTFFPFMGTKASFADLELQGKEYDAKIQERLDNINKASVSKHKESLDEILKDTRGMNSQELLAYAKYLQEKADLYKDDKELRLKLLDEVTAAINKSFDLELKRIEEIGDAFRGMGSFISQFDRDLGTAISGLSELTSMYSQYMTATTVYGKGAAGIGAASTVMGIMDIFADKFFDKSDEIEKSLRRIAAAVKKFDYQLRLVNDDIDNSFGTRKVAALIEGYSKIKDRIIELNAALKKDPFSEEIRQRLEMAKDEIVEIGNELDQILTGTTAQNIADSITDGLRQGLDSAEVFADTFNGLMREALYGAFNRQIMTELMEPWYEDFTNKAYGGLTPDEIEKLKSSYELMGIRIKDIYQSFSDIMDATGIATETGEATKTGLAGAIAGVSEETAGLLAGQVGNLMISTIKIRDTFTGPNGEMFKRADLSLNNLRDISDYGHAIRGYNYNMMNDISVIMSTCLSNLRANQETAVNTRYIKAIYQEIMTSSGSIGRAIGV